MKILLVAATVFEIAPLLEHLEKNCKKISFIEYQNDNHSIFTLVTGVGSVYTALSLSRYAGIREIDVAINVGIAGSFDTKLDLGSVVEIVEDRFGDLGVEEADGSFTDIHQLDLIGKDYFPFDNGSIKNDAMKIDFGLPKKSAVTVNKVHGTKASIDAVVNKYHPDVETMEGAAFMMTCKTMDVKFHQVRAISNYVEPRNKDNWKLNLAIDNLNAILIKALS
jgi:futalosine hydrolase